MREPTPGEMTLRCTLYRVTHSPASGSMHTRVRMPIWQCWCKLEVIGGSVYWDNQQTEDAISHRIIIRQCKGNTRPQDLPRLVEVECDGIWYRVKRVTALNAGRWFTLLECEVLNAADNQNPGGAETAG